jgi:dUTP pyrophosphatase
MKVRIKKLSSEAVIPIYAKGGDAGMDMTATKIINETLDSITYGTDIAMEIPEGFVGLIFPRSSVRKTHLFLSNSVGVVDSGYRGEIQATFKKIQGISNKALDNYKVGDRIMQIMIIPHPYVNFIEVEELSNTERGESGFGSTGK